MGDSSTSERLTCVLLSAEQDCASSIRRELCPDDGVWDCELDGKKVQIGVKSGIPTPPTEWIADISEADAVALAVHYLDVITLDQLRDVCTLLGDHQAKLAVFLYRKAGEIDYKMSCPYCGQKLWVRDTDVNKRGRCPNCKKAFILPDQSEHVRAELDLHPGVLITRLEGGNDTSIRSAFRLLLDQLSA
ncbi:MAG: putative Zn-ribbon and HTH transcriptional regulator [Kiritimatiellia bacterium]|jgi:predicted Zn-ribbon and HTH transcriptional regulator